MPAKFNLDYEGLQPGMAGGLFSNLAACDATLPAKQKYMLLELYDEQEAYLNIAGAQLHSGHLL